MANRYHKAAQVLTLDGKRFYSAEGLRRNSRMIAERYADHLTVGAMLRVHKVKEAHRVNGVKYFDLEKIETLVKETPTRSEAAKKVRAREKAEPKVVVAQDVDPSMLREFDKKLETVPRTFLLLAEVSAKLDKVMRAFEID